MACGSSQEICYNPKKFKFATICLEMKHDHQCSIGTTANENEKNVVTPLLTSIVHAVVNHQAKLNKNLVLTTSLNRLRKVDLLLRRTMPTTTRHSLSHVLRVFVRLLL